MNYFPLPVIPVQHPVGVANSIPFPTLASEQLLNHLHVTAQGYVFYCFVIVSTLATSITLSNKAFFFISQD
uniref:Uncharacterized protein n=1 Tax=Anguilla anguilla TaxID=7936 RepID=A0A0E9S3H5_ANGAN